MTLSALLQASAERHSHLCPRQVLGVRMGLLAGSLLGLDLPQQDKRMLTIAETDGCAVDGLEIATGCSLGHRTLRVEDFGKVAATFVDIRRERAVRIVPRSSARQRAAAYAREARDRWHAQLLGYQRMPIGQLLTWEWVTLIVPVSEIVSLPDARAVCDQCHEEITNEREVRRGAEVLCRACAGEPYYRPVLIASEEFAEQPRGDLPDRTVRQPDSSGGFRAGHALALDASIVESAVLAKRQGACPRTPHGRELLDEALP
jgi:formylmethanofuran dehydrogenase subunit E